MELPARLRIGQHARHRQGVAAIDHDDLAPDHGSLRAAQESDQVGNIFGGHYSAGWCMTNRAGDYLVIRAVQIEVLQSFGLNYSGGNLISPRCFSRLTLQPDSGRSLPRQLCLPQLPRNQAAPATPLGLKLLRSPRRQRFNQGHRPLGSEQQGPGH